MGLPQNNKEIILLRQGTATPTYDENSRQVFKCLWEEVEHIKCVDHMPTSRGSEVMLLLFMVLKVLDS